MRRLPDRSEAHKSWRRLAFVAVDGRNSWTLSWTVVATQTLKTAGPAMVPPDQSIRGTGRLGARQACSSCVSCDGIDHAFALAHRSHLPVQWADMQAAAGPAIDGLATSDNVDTDAAAHLPPGDDDLVGSHEDPVGAQPPLD